MSPQPRRSGRRRILAAAALMPALGLAGCGFALQAPPAIAWQRLHLRGFAPRSAMAELLRSQLPDGVRLTAQPAEAQLVLQALEDRLYRTVAAQSASGLVRELRLRVVLRLRLLRPDGQVLMESVELERSTDLSYTETAAPAKEAEEAVLVREMRGDIVRQVLRVLATTGPDTAPAAPAASAPAAG